MHPGDTCRACGTGQLQAAAFHDGLVVQRRDRVVRCDGCGAFAPRDSWHAPVRLMNVVADRGSPCIHCGADFCRTYRGGDVTMKEHMRCIAAVGEDCGPRVFVDHHGQRRFHESIRRVEPTSERIEQLRLRARAKAMWRECGRLRAAGLVEPTLVGQALKRAVNAPRSASPTRVVIWGTDRALLERGNSRWDANPAADAFMCIRAERRWPAQQPRHPERDLAKRERRQNARGLGVG
jgi:hypothetical protein